MKKITIKTFSAGVLISMIAASAFVGIRQLSRQFIEAKAVSLPTTLDLNDCTNEEIRQYYSGLSSKSSEELTGTNLLKNLKGVIANNVSYFSYDNCTSIFVLTDRDWVNSPASSLPGTYNASTNTVTGYSHSSDINNNPYIHMLYCDYSVKDKTKYKGDGDVSTTSKSFDNEHAWSQTHGFKKGDSIQNLTGAGSDLHHLIAGTQYGNRTLHSNYSYGFVKENDSSWTSAMSSKPYETKNKRGEPLFAHSEDQQAKVFEPQDSDKGDIARALLYMVACYNNFDGSTPTNENPALKLVNYVISENTSGLSSENLEYGYYGILQDLLAWHKLDPVDDYEIHRNNLIYKNYQHNRNPFIDFPEWVDYAWGTVDYNPGSKTISYNPASTGSANPNSDAINGYNIVKVATNLEITTMPTKTVYSVGEQFDRTGMVVTATFEDNTTADVTGACTFTVDMSSVGEKEVTVKYQSLTKTFKITVNEAPKEKSIFEKIPWWVYVIVAVVVILIIVGIFAGVLKVNKKGKIKVSKSGVKKIVKGSKKKQ